MADEPSSSIKYLGIQVSSNLEQVVMFKLINKNLVELELVIYNKEYFL